MMNIKLNYLYRDAGNYKTYGFIIFGNPNGLNTKIIENKLREHFVDADCFDPSKLNIPPLKHANSKYDSELDHSWNEFESLEETDEEATDHRTINELLNI